MLVREEDASPFWYWFVCRWEEFWWPIVYRYGLLYPSLWLVAVMPIIEQFDPSAMWTVERNQKEIL